MPVCSRCKEDKPPEDFYKDYSETSKRRVECKKCTLEHTKTDEYKAAKRVYQKEYRDRRRAEGTWPPVKVEGRKRGRPKGT